MPLRDSNQHPMHLVNHKYLNCATTMTLLRNINLGLPSLDRSAHERKAIREALINVNRKHHATKKHINPS
jgi:hypothetical protein